MSAEMQSVIAATLGADCAVAVTDQDWIEVKPVNPLRDKIDFIRIAQDDTHWQVFHLAHNEVIKGAASVSGSLIGYLPTMVRELCEVIW